MTTIDTLIDTLIHDLNFGMIPYNPNAEQTSKDLFTLFNNTNKDTIYKSLLNKNIDNSELFRHIMQLVNYYKGNFSFFDTSIDFQTFQKIKPWLCKESLNVFNLKFFNELGYLILETNDTILLDENILDLIINNNMKLYFQIAKKFNIPNAIVKIFEKNNILVFDWLNESINMYQELIKLNQPDFILTHMNGKLDIKNDSIKYIIETATPTYDLYVAIKHKIGLHELWRLANYKANELFFIDIVETFDEFLFILNLPHISLTSLELILNKSKLKFPHIYENFNSLLLVKKEINNK